MDLIDIVNQIIQNNTDAQKFTDLAIGTVASINPLTITVSANLPPLPEEVLLLSESVKEYTEDVKIDHWLKNAIEELQTAAGITVHTENIIGKAKHPGLEADDKVLMLRVMKWQQYIVLSKI